MKKFVTRKMSRKRHIDLIQRTAAFLIIGALGAIVGLVIGYIAGPERYTDSFSFWLSYRPGTWVPWAVTGMAFALGFLWRA
jgi:hypothetical protein